MIPWVDLDKRRKPTAVEKRQFVEPVTNADRRLAPQLRGAAFLQISKSWVRNQ